MCTRRLELRLQSQTRPGSTASHDASVFDPRPLLSDALGVQPPAGRHARPPGRRLSHAGDQPPVPARSANLISTISPRCCAWRAAAGGEALPLKGRRMYPGRTRPPPAAAALPSVAAVSSPWSTSKQIRGSSPPFSFVCLSSACAYRLHPALPPLHRHRNRNVLHNTAEFRFGEPLPPPLSFAPAL